MELVWLLSLLCPLLCTYQRKERELACVVDFDCMIVLGSIGTRNLAHHLSTDKINNKDISQSLIKNTKEKYIIHTEHFLNKEKGFTE